VESPIKNTQIRAKKTEIDALIVKSSLPCRVFKLYNPKVLQA
jgi:hypothetical protein